MSVRVGVAQKKVCYAYLNAHKSPKPVTPIIVMLD